jgi:hypothetical protein
MRIVFSLFLLLGSLQVGADQTCDTTEYPLSSPTERFVDNGDGTVTDQVAKLTWVRCSAGQEWSGGTCEGVAAEYSWDEAQQEAAEANLSGVWFFSDWRLPKIRELAMIAERQCQNPRINLTVFPATPAGVYWSDSSRPGEDADSVAYGLSFGPEGVLNLSKAERHYVRFVRSAQ